MKQNLKRLASESFIYGIPMMMSRMVALFMVPLYTAVLSEGDYGILALTASGPFALFTLFIILALDGAAHVWYWANPTPDEQQRTISTWFWTSQISGLVLGIAGFFGAAELAATVFKAPGPVEVQAVRLMAMTLPFNFASVVVQNWLRMQRRALHCAIYCVGILILNVSLCATFILGAKRGILGNFEAMALANIIIYISSLFLLRGNVSPRAFSPPRLREMMRYAVPLIFCALPAWSLGFIDRYLLEQYHSKGEVGLYHIGATLAQGVALVTGAFTAAWGPFALSIQRESDHRVTYAAAFIAYLLAGGLLASALAVFAPEAIAVLTNKNYAGAADVAGILSVGVVALGLSYVAATGMAVQKKSRQLAVAYTIAAAVLAAGSALLVPGYGRVGAAIASAAAWLVVPLWCFAAAHRSYPIPYPFFRGAVVALAFCAGAWAVSRLPPGIGHPGETEGIRVSRTLVVNIQSLAVKFAGWVAIGVAGIGLSLQPLRQLLAARRRTAEAGTPCEEAVRGPEENNTLESLL